MRGDDSLGIAVALVGLVFLFAVGSAARRWRIEDDLRRAQQSVEYTQTNTRPTSEARPRRAMDVGQALGRDGQRSGPGVGSLHE